MINRDYERLRRPARSSQIAATKQKIQSNDGWRVTLRLTIPLLNFRLFCEFIDRSLFSANRGHSLLSPIVDASEDDELYK